MLVCLGGRSAVTRVPTAASSRAVGPVACDGERWGRIAEVESCCAAEDEHGERCLLPSPLHSASVLFRPLCRLMCSCFFCIVYYYSVFFQL